MAVLILSEDTPIIEEMNTLGTSSADNKRYDELRALRQTIFEAAIPYLETTFKLKPKDVQAAKTLMNIYRSTSNTDKYQAMKAKVKNLKLEIKRFA